jgi:DNA-binding NarL/FixJ family response regulator
VIADSQYLTRIGLRSVLSKIKDLQLISETTSEGSLLAAVKSKNPDLVILDYNQPRKFSTSTISKVKAISPQTQVLIISADENKQRIYESIESGASSFLTKECEQSEIVDAIYSTSRGDKFFCKKVLNYIVEKSFPRDNDCSPTVLSPRERQIVQLISEGKIAKEIADILNLSTHTVYTHRKNIMKKLRLGGTSELVKFAIRSGLAEVE